MPRPKKTIRTIEKSITLPEDLVVQVELLLFSELEGKVPFAAWQQYISELIGEDLLLRKQAAEKGRQL